MNPTLKVSVVTKKSLLEITDFEKYTITESELTTLPIHDVVKVFDRVKEALCNLKEEKATFLATTNLRRNSNAFDHEIAKMNIRRQKLVKNYSIIEGRLRSESHSFKTRIRNEEKAEFLYLLTFWKNAKTLNPDFFNQITEETEKTIALPETLKGDK